MAAPDPFATLDRVVAKYKRDVHAFADGASADALDALESHLGRRLPLGLRAFLTRHNGADLFRGALAVRSSSDIAPASEAVRSVVLFADGADGTRWAYGRLSDGRSLFGAWDGERLHPAHASFFGWLDATLEVLDAHAARQGDQDAIRFEADSQDPCQLVLAGLRALRAGRPEEARPLLEQASRADAGHVVAWQRLGDALAATDRSAARAAWLRALHATRLPLPFPGAPTLDPEILPVLARAMPDPEAWERELERFLSERVHEVRADDEFDLLLAAVGSLADSLTRRGRRERAREVLRDVIQRSTLFAVQRVPWAALVRLAELEIDLGHHDEAETLLRQVRREGPAHLQAQALALLGRIAVTREEPWAEEILDEALEHDPDEDTRLRVALLHVERALRQDHLAAAGAHLETAQALVARGAPRLLRAGAALLAGDVARARGDESAAAAAYARALESLGDRPAPQVRLRLEVRFGDLARAQGDVETAARRYAAAVRGYADHQLPVREGWAMLRLARLAADPEPLLSAARTRFLEADLAVGIAAIDALTGRVGDSLPWHLNRATDHARARTNAQRSRPPWTRADAERSERRLGTHRLAIAAAGDAVVDALSAELDGAARTIREGRGRPLDPAVLRYVAAVDLLAGHRSYRAAEVLLRHLMAAEVDGAAQRALLGAVARSPNAALVDGLLLVVERPSGAAPAAVALAAEVLGMRREAAAVGSLRALAGVSAGLVARKAAITALGRVGERAAVDDVVAGLDHPRLAESAALSLLMLGDRRGIDFHVRALYEHRTDLQGHPGEIVGRYGGPSHLPALLPAASGPDEAMAVGALQGLGLLGDPRAVPTLLHALDPRQPGRARVASAALTLVTGHRESEDEPALARRWSAWWEEHGGRFPLGVRHRLGRRMDAGLLIELMADDESWTRRTAYDELVITTGHHLPFDADGPWRVQLAHLRAWRAWWATARSRLPGGGWYLDGRPVG